MTSTQDGQASAGLRPALAALVAKHSERLDAALAAIAGRGYWSAYPESPSPRVYGEGTAEAGKAAFEAHLGKPFPLDQPSAPGWSSGNGLPRCASNAAFPASAVPSPYTRGLGDSG